MQLLGKGSWVWFSSAGPHPASGPKAKERIKLPPYKWLRPQPRRYGAHSRASAQQKARGKPEMEQSWWLVVVSGWVFQQLILGGRDV